MKNWLHDPIWFAPLKKLGGGWIANKSSPSPPPAPDYAGAATAQGAANENTARVQGQIANPNINTPYGTQTVSWNGDQPTINQTLSPEQQTLLDSQNRISGNLANTAETGLNRVSGAMSTPFDSSNINPLQADPQARQAAQNAAYQQATSRLDPQWNTAQDKQETQLRNQGVVPGSEAYDNAMRDFNFGKNDAYSSAYNNSFNQGLNAQTQDFGMQSQANTQNAQMQAYLRSLPLNELNALRTGSQVTNPQFQQFNAPSVGQTPVMQGAMAQGQANQNLYNQQAGSANAFNSGLMGMVGTGVGYAMGGPFGAAAGRYVFGG